MPELISQPVRRNHVLVDKTVTRPYQMRCPDCNALLFELIEWVTGCTKHKCNKCKHLWMFIFHDNDGDFLRAVNFEGSTTELYPMG